MSTLKKIEDFKNDFAFLEKKEMNNIVGGMTKSWTEATSKNGVCDLDHMSQDFRWSGEKWVADGPAWRTKQTIVVSNSICG